MSRNRAFEREFVEGIQDPDGVPRVWLLPRTLPVQPPKSTVPAAAHSKPHTGRDIVPFGEGATVQREFFGSEDATSTQYVTILPTGCIVPSEDQASVLQDALEQLVKAEDEAKKGTSSIDSQHITRIQSFPAVRATISRAGPDGTKTRGAALIIFRGPTMVTVMATSQDAGGEDETFVDSFRFLDRTPPAGPSCRALPGTT